MSLTFPDPPIYVKLYTEEALRKAKCPPPPPIPDAFTVFGETFDLKAVSFFYGIACIFHFCLASDLQTGWIWPNFDQHIQQMTWKYIYYF